jgi:hypothetical protein
MDFVIVLVILAGVVLFVSAPLRRAEPAAAGAGGRDPAAAARGRDLADLEAARAAKYREIRDAELDHRTGKLSDEDYAEIDGSLRAEAVEILHAIDTIEKP